MVRTSATHPSFVMIFLPGYGYDFIGYRSDYCFHLPGSVVPYRLQLFVACQAKTDATSFGALSVKNCCSIWVVGVHSRGIGV